MNFEELKSRPLADLRILAAKYGIKTHHKAKAETVAKLIVEHITAPVKPLADAMKHPAEQQPKPPAPIHTEEAVRTAIKTALEKQGFTATFHGDDTATFRCRGAEESVHLSTVMRRIVMIANSVSVGARNPRILRDSQTNSTVNSGTIMMV